MAASFLFHDPFLLSASDLASLDRFSLNELQCSDPVELLNPSLDVLYLLLKPFLLAQETLVVMLDTTKVLVDHLSPL